MPVWQTAKAPCRLAETLLSRWRALRAPRALFFAVIFSSFFAFVSLALSADQMPANQIPKDLQDIGIEEHLGAALDLSLKFSDEAGQSVTLGKYINGTKPVLFLMVYYECPNLCTFVLNATVDALKQLTWLAGQNYEVVAVSIDPREKPSLATRKKAAYIKELGRPAAASGWHFLTGEQAEITALAHQFGFKFKWDEDQKQFAHASAMGVLTPQGKISRYFYGIQYPARDVKVALLEAGQGKVGTILDKILLFCYHYDASTKKYVLYAGRAMSVGGAVTVLVLALFFIFAWRKERFVNHSIPKAFNKPFGG